MPMILSRRALLSTLLASVATTSFAQPKPPSKPAGPKKLFEVKEILIRAENLAKTPFNVKKPADNPLTFDQYRAIRFKPEKAINLQGFKLHTFHQGFIYKEAIAINIIRDNVSQPLAYQPQNYEFSGVKIPANSHNHAGFRLHYPLNEPNNHDELISFLGASYFRFLGRNQVYGISARGLAINSGEKTPEEFPIFREFWLEQGKGEQITLHALLDSPSVTGAYQFTIYPSDKSVIDIKATLFARENVAKLGLAPLTSMFMKAENDQRVSSDFRPELHDSDGLMIHGSSGEWLWRPLRNPETMEVSAFLDEKVKGFGLMQRDRTFEHYQDLDLNYEQRPSYWVEPREGFGKGRVELVELPTLDETNDNIVAYFVAEKPLLKGERLDFSYSLTSTLREAALHTGAKAINTFKTRAAALGSHEIAAKNTVRIIIDFAGGELEYFLKNPEMVQIVPSVDNGKIIRTFLIPNKQTKGFRAGIDIEGVAGKTANLRAYLRSGTRALSETWTMPWSVN